MTDNSETLTLSVEKAAGLLGISPGLAYDLRSGSSCGRRQLRHPATVRAKSGKRFSVTAITGIGRSAGGATAWEDQTDGRLVTDGVMGVARSIGDSIENNAAAGRTSGPKLPTREVRMMPRSNHGPTGRARLLDIDAVAVQLAVTPRHIRRLVAERRIPYIKVGRFIRFDPAEVDAWLDAARRPELQSTGRWRSQL